MYYRLILDGGHRGAGKSLDVVRYFRGENPVDLFGKAARMPRVKGKSRALGVKLVEPITVEEYRRGVEKSKRNPYLRML